MLTEKTIRQLWEHMAMIYGHKWTSAFGAEDNGTWLAGLRDVTPRQIGEGLEKCRTSAEPWPPTLPQFRAMCLPEKLASYHRPALPPPPIPQEQRVNIVNKHMPKIREVLE